MNSASVTAQARAFSSRSRSSQIPAAAEHRFDVSSTPIAMRVPFALEDLFRLELKYALESPNPLFSYT